MGEGEPDEEAEGEEGEEELVHFNLINQQVRAHNIKCGTAMNYH